jgi:hypothetical protein
MAEYPSAITAWHDTAQVYARLQDLVKQPPRTIRREKLAEFQKYFEERCQKSKALTDEAKEYIPGGVQHNLAFNYPFPLAIDRAEGAYLWDVDGNCYTDFLQAGGPTMLGNNSPALREKIQELPVLYRESFVLRHLQGLDYADIAKITEVPADTVRVRAYRAREMLRQTLAKNVDTFWREKAAKEKGTRDKE